MAGERILIVDDTPVNLKLTRILLVNEGYTVRTAGSAEEALELLPSYQPRLILADIQLPGIDGLEMTRRIKRNPRTREVVVIALTAFAMMGDESRALEAGCEGYITKPIDTRTLGSQIRELLGQHPEPADPAGDKADGGAKLLPEAVPAAELVTLRARFLEEGSRKARQLIVDLDGLFDAAEWARTVHQWVGTGGLLGYPGLSRVAREVETLLRERPLDAAQVRESMTTLLLAFETSPEAAEAPVPHSILRALAGRRVALAGLPASETQRLGIALERASARAVFLAPNATTTDANREGCDLVAAYIPPGSDGSMWAGAMTVPRLPAVLIGDREDIAALDPAVQRLAAGLLIDAWQPDEALIRLSVAIAGMEYRLPPLAAGPLRVVVADGDAAVVAHVSAALRNTGIEVHVAADGERALASIRSLRAQGAILGDGLRGLDSQGVLTLVRAEGLAVRVMLLTARQHEGDVIRGFELGASDYVVTPFSPMELLARLKRLLAK